MAIIVNWIISAFAVMLSSYLLPGVRVDDFVTALLVAAVLGVLNAVVKPILVLLTIPLTLLTLGLFLLVINALVIMMADSLVDGFETGGFFWALVFSIIMALVSGLLSQLAEK
jgi:putative membrane protein